MKVELNPDNTYVDEIRARLKANDGYCPCAVENTPDTKCMCKSFREQIDAGQTGYCHCELYRISK